jgi:hypothetical protein
MHYIHKILLILPLGFLLFSCTDSPNPGVVRNETDNVDPRGPATGSSTQGRVPQSDTTGGRAAAPTDTTVRNRGITGTLPGAAIPDKTSPPGTNDEKKRQAE